MNGYICTKSCNFGGVAYNIGDAIPFDAVLPSRERILINQGYIAPQLPQPEEVGRPQGPVEVEKDITVPIIAKEGTLELILSPGEVVEAIRILQLNAKEAAKAIGQVEKEEVLIMIDALDERSTVQTAAAAKARELGEQGKEEEQKGEDQEPEEPQEPKEEGQEEGQGDQ